MSDLWLPKSSEDLEALPASDVISRQTRGLRAVVKTGPGVLIMYARDLAEKVICAQFALDEAALPVPRILYYPGDPHHVVTVQNLIAEQPLVDSVWYICMEQVPGVSLDKVIDTMTVEELDHVAAQLKLLLLCMRTIQSKTLGSVSEGPYRNTFFPPNVSPKRSFTSVEEFIDQYRSLFTFIAGGNMDSVSHAYVDTLLSPFPRDCPMYFTHGDLLPKNIMVQGSTVTALIDWAEGGFYPEFWEYCRMHDRNFMTPGWAHILQAIFPGERRTKEIDGSDQLLDII